MGPEEIARHFYQLFNERRLKEAGELVDPEADFHYIPTRQRLIGRAGYRAIAAAWLTAFEDARLEVERVRAVADDVVEVEFVGRGTHTGELVLGDSTILPATGNQTQLSFRERMHIRDGRIVASQLDFDLDEMRRDLLGQ